MEKVYIYDSVSSTADIIKQLALEGAADGTAVIARSQTSGRGRMGRSFHSPMGKGVYLSVLLRPEESSFDSEGLTARSAVAVSRAVFGLYGVMPMIKWVNDLLLGGKKICGILTQGSFGAAGRLEWASLGVGINVLHKREDFPSELRSKASSLLEQTGLALEPDRVAQAVLSELKKARGHTQSEEYLEHYRRHCLTLGKSVMTSDGGIKGIAEGIDDTFALLVRSLDGTLHRVRTGEASIRTAGGEYI